MNARKLATLLILCGLLGLGTSAAHGELGAARGGIGIDVEIAHVLDEIEASSAKQLRLADEAKSIGTRRSQTRETLKMRVRALYRVTRAGMAPIAGGFDAVRQHVARVRRLTGFIHSDTTTLQRLDARGGELKGEVSTVTAELIRARSRLAALQEHESPQPGDGMQVLAQSGTAAPRDNGNSNGFYGMRYSDDNEGGNAGNAASGFEALRGHLEAPISGEVRMIDARREESDGPGVEFQAPAGTPVHAAANGRVAFCDRYGSYGKLVILDHGDGYYTAYGGLGAVEVRVGDDLSAHARVGSVGSNTSGGASALFFEVRKGTRTLPPRGWLGL